LTSAFLKNSLKDDRGGRSKEKLEKGVETENF